MANGDLALLLLDNLLVEEGHGRAEIVKVELLSNPLVDIGLLRHDLVVSHFDNVETGVLIQDHRCFTLAASLINYSGLTPLASTHLDSYGRSGYYLGEALPATNYSKETKNELLVGICDILPLGDLKQLETVVDEFSHLLLPLLVFASRNCVNLTDRLLPFHLSGSLETVDAHIVLYEFILLLGDHFESSLGSREATDLRLGLTDQQLSQDPDVGQNARRNGLSLPLSSTALVDAQLECISWIPVKTLQQSLLSLKQLLYVTRVAHSHQGSDKLRLTEDNGSSPAWWLLLERSVCLYGLKGEWEVVLDLLAVHNLLLQLVGRQVRILDYWLQLSVVGLLQELSKLSGLLMRHSLGDGY